MLQITRRKNELTVADLNGGGGFVLTFTSAGKGKKDTAPVLATRRTKVGKKGGFEKGKLPALTPGTYEVGNTVTLTNSRGKLTVGVDKPCTLTVTALNVQGGMLLG